MTKAIPGKEGESKATFTHKGLGKSKARSHALEKADNQQGGNGSASWGRIKK